MMCKQKGIHSFLSQRFVWLPLLFACVVSLIMIFPAYAQIDRATFYVSGECPVGGTGETVSFYAPNCQATGIISEFICSYETIVSEILSETYCTMVDTMRVPLAAMLTLFVTFWGVMLLTGQTPFTARDGFIMLLKFAFVYAAATEASFTLGYIYNGVMGILQGGVILILEGMNNTQLSGSGSILSLIDEQVAGVLTSFTQADDAVPGEFKAEDCKGAVLAMSIMFLASAPAITILAFTMIFKLAMVAIRTVFAYLMALTGIMFLITLVPVFASFLLFRTTAGMFDMWVKYLLSFALQVVIVFAFIGFVIKLDVLSDFEELLNLSAPYENTKMISGWRFPFQICSICKGLTTDADGGLTCPPDPETGGPVGTDPMEPIAMVDMLALLGGRFLYLLIMAYILEAVLAKAPEIAVTISQARFAPTLGTSVEARFQSIGNGITNGVSKVLGK